MKESITAVILAGGRSSRMQYRDKGLMVLNDRSMISHIAERLSSQVKDILISANNNLEQYAKYSYRVLPDEHQDYRGPMAGICEALKVIDTQFLLVVPCDGPLLPLDLASRLENQVLQKKASLATVYDGQYKQPTYSLIQVDMLHSALEFLARGERKLGLWLKENNAELVDFSDQPNAFVNINSDADLEKLTAIILENAVAIYCGPLKH